MDRSRRMMGADGGRVLHRDRRTSKLAVVVAVQNVLVTACLVVTLYVYIQSQSQSPEKNVHIQFSPISDISGSVTLKFDEVLSQHNMSLAVEKNKIYVSCSGPYVLHMDLCYQSAVRDSGTLQLQMGSEPVCNFSLNASSEVCRGLHCIAYLRAKEEASLHLHSTDTTFKIKNVTVGLSYLLGSRCEF